MNDRMVFSIEPIAWKRERRTVPYFQAEKALQRVFAPFKVIGTDIDVVQFLRLS
jgi:hypothetical protein|tara:strand:+ start:557 stop:718 length:162 start_codon:yes stop_codon:yes gene_type:complete